MPERIDLIVKLLEDQAKEQRAATALIGQLRTDVSVVKESLNRQQVSHERLHGDVGTAFERIRDLEKTTHAIPQIERELAQAASRHDSLEGRMRAVETEASGARVQTGMIADGAGAAMKFLLTLAAGAILGIGGAVLAHAVPM